MENKIARIIEQNCSNSYDDDFGCGLFLTNDALFPIAKEVKKLFSLPIVNKGEVELLIAFSDWVFEQPLSLGGRERELVKKYLKSKQ